METTKSKPVYSATYTSRNSSGVGGDGNDSSQTPQSTSAQPSNTVGSQHQSAVEPTNVGEISQQAQKAENTIVTHDKPVDFQPSVGTFDTPLLDKAATTEKTHDFSTLMDRWVPVANVEITSGDDYKAGKIVGQIQLPITFYKNDVCAPITLPFRQFLYGKLTTELMVKVNSLKTQAGKIVVSILPNSANLYEDADDYYSLTAAIQRSHVQIDFAGDTDVMLPAEWLYHKSFMRSFTGSSEFIGTKAGEYARLLMHMLSPISTGQGSSNTVTVTILARVAKHKFAGMTFSKNIVTTQMLGSVRQGVTTFRKAVECTEGFLDNLDRLTNMDKPTDLFSKIIAIPAPRLSLAHGKGVADCTPMRLDPSALTTYTPDHTRSLQSTSIMAIARVWSLLDNFKWADTQAYGTVLYTLTVNPSNFLPGKVTRGRTTLEHVVNMYQFWRGTLELRIDFVSTTLHTGSVQISVEFGRTSDTADICASASTYVKTFDLGDQRTVSIVIPYIYDTVWRRSHNVPLMSWDHMSCAETWRHFSGVFYSQATQVKVRVLNKLRATSNVVASSVNCLIYVRGGSSFAVHGIIPSNLNLSMTDTADGEVDSFPYSDKYTPTAPRVQAGFFQSRSLKSASTTSVGTTTTTTTTTTERIPIKEEITTTTTQRPTTSTTTAESRSVKEETSLPWYATNWKQVDAHYVMREEILAKYPGLTFDYDNTMTPTRMRYKKNRQFIEVTTAQRKEIVDNIWRNTKPRAQMMTDGAQDETPDLSGGARMQTIQSSENQMSIIDILRRPVMIIYDALINNFDVGGRIDPPSGFFIPLMPPQPLLFANISGNLFTPATSKAATTNLTSLFRMWRGSMRYTFIFHGKGLSQALRFYVVHLPKSGTRMVGNARWPFSWPDSQKKQSTYNYYNFHPSQLGLATELIVPSINNTIHVEVPFSTELNWALLHQGKDGVKSVMPWRDKVDDNVGHLLVICPYDNVRVDVFWAAGDDFRLTGFLGVPESLRGGGAYDDNAAATQAIWDAFRGYAPSFEETVRWTSRAALVGAAGWALPGGAHMASMWMAGKTIDNVHTATSDLTHTIKMCNERVLPSIADAAGNATNIMHSLSTFGGDIGSIVSTLAKSILAPFTGEFYTRMYEKMSGVLVEFFRAWMNFSPTGVAMSVISILSQLGLITTSWFMKLAAPITEFVAKVLFPPVEEQAGEEEVDESGLSTESLANFCGLAVAALGAVFAVDVSVVRSPLSFAGGLFKQMFKTSTWSVITHATRFFKDTLELFKRIAYKIAGYKDARTEALLELTSKSAFLKKFVRDANLFLMESNTSAVVRLPGLKLKFWLTLINAHQILSKVLFLPKEGVSLVLISLCRQVIKKGNELHVQMSNCPVRYDPFVISISGKPGIGKSFVVDEVIYSLLEAVGFKELVSEVKFVKNPSPQYWNGYKDQPVIVFDDFLNIRTSPYGEEQISDLYTLKSPAIFNPNMARLEEKEIRANPLIVILVTNDPFPALDFITEKKAVLRRRDYMAEFTVDESVKMTDVRARGANHGVNFDHIRVNKYGDNEQPDSLGAENWTMSEFLSDICEKFKVYHEQEKKFIKGRIQKMQRLLPENAQRYGSIEDPFTIFYRAIADVDDDPELHSSTALMPSEMLTIAAERIARQIEEGLPGTHPIQEQEAGPSRPEAQAGIPLQKLLTTKLKQWKEYFTTKLTRSVQNARGIPGYCVVCRDDQSICARCPSHTDEAPHSICYPCFMGIVAATNRAICPICRSHTMERVTPHDSFMKTLTQMMYAVPYVAGQSAMEAAMIITNIALNLCDALISPSPSTILFWLFVTITGGKAPAAISMATFATWRFANNMVSAVDPTLGNLRAGVGLNVNALAEEGEEGPEVEQFVDAVMDHNNGNLLDQLRVPQVQLYYGLRTVQLDAVDVPNDTIDQECQHHLIRWDFANYEKQDETGEDGFFQMDLLNPGIRYWASLKRCTNNCAWTFDDQHKWLEKWATHNYYTLSYMLDLGNGQNPADYMPKVFIPRTHPAILERNANIISANAAIDALVESTWWDKLTGATADLLKTIIPYLKYGLLAIGTVLSVKQAYDWFFKQAEAVQMGATGYGTSVARIPREQAVRFVPRASTQNNSTSVINKVLRNQGHIAVVVQGLEENWLAWIGVCEHYALINRHSWEFLLEREAQGEVIFKIRFALAPKITYEVKPSDLEKLEIGLSDIIVIKFQPQVPQFKDIRSYFMTEKDLYGQALNTYGTMVEPPQFRGYEAPTVHPIDFKRYIAEKTVGARNGDIVLQDIVEYNYSRKGACGAVVMCDAQERPILGLHSAGLGVGNNGVGYAVLVTRENLNILKPLIQAEIPYLDETREPTVFFPEDVALIVKGGVEKGHESFVPNTTKIVASLVQTFLPPVLTEPTILTFRDKRHQKEWLPPLVAGCSKQGKLVRPLPVHALAAVREYMMEWKKQFKPTLANCRTLTYEEAIMGLKNVEYFDPIPMNTSSGWPWTTLRQTKNKHAFIELKYGEDNYPNHCTIDPLLREALDLNYAMRANNILAPMVTSDMLKDERKKISKVRKEGGTRVFSAYPIDGTIAMRQHFLHYSSAMMRGRFKTGSAVGIARDGPEWGALYSYLTEVGRKTICIDYKNFGPGFSAQALEVVIDSCLEWHRHMGFSDDHVQQLKCILKEHQQCLHIARNVIYQTTAGSPSGSAGTVILNTDVNLVYIMMAWVLLTKLPFYVFQEQVRVVCYGDDVIMTVADKIVEKFNAVTIAECFAEYGIGISAASKEEGELDPYIDILDATFLKSGFTPHPTRGKQFLAPLDWTSVEECAKWVHKADDPRQATITNAETSLRMAYGHGKTRFKEWKNVLNKALLKIALPPLTLTWEECDGIFFDGTVSLWQLPLNSESTKSAIFVLPRL